MTSATILTLANGRGIDLLNPKPEDIDFAVVAEHLAKEKRYNGATPNIEYSVAEHCCRGSDAILASARDSTLAAYFLLHDAHEAFLKDDPTPKKRALMEIARNQFDLSGACLLAAFNNLEDRMDTAVHQAAGLPWPVSRDVADRLKHWDRVLFVTEWRDLMKGIKHPDWKPFAEIKPLRHRIEPEWPWAMAKAGFLLRANRLLPSLKERAA